MGRGRCSPCQTYQPQECYPSNGGQTCDNSNFYPSNADQMAYNNSCRRGTRGGCGDVAGGDTGVIIPEANAFGTPEQYDTAVKGACKYTDQNYDQALKDAAAKGQPVVAVFGSKDTPDTQKLLNTVAAAAKNGAADATYVYIDMDRVAQNPNSGLAKFVDANVRGHNLAHTIVFTQKPDAAGNPVPEPAMMSTWGGREQIQGMLSQHVKYGQDAMKGRQFNVKPSDAGDGTAPKADAQEKAKPAEKNNAELLKDIDSGLEAGKNAKDWREGEKAYIQAIRAADKVDQNALKADIAKAQDAKKVAEGTGDQTKIKELQTQIDQMQKLQDAAWKTRMEFGFACMKWNQNYKDIGEQWLMSAGDRNPNMYMDPAFRNRLRDAGYTPQTENTFAKRVAQHELNKIGPAGPGQQQDVGPDGKPKQTPADRVSPSQATDRQNPNNGRPPIKPDVRPVIRPEVKPQVQPQVRPEVKPPVQPPVRPDGRPEVRPQVKPEVKPQVKPEVKPPAKPEQVKHPEIPNLVRAGHDGNTTQDEFNALAKAADEGLVLKAAWGATWCPKCPPQLANFERNAQGRKDAVYFTNHDMDGSNLASQIQMYRGSAPQFHSYTVQRVSETEFKVTPQGSNRGYTVKYNRR